MQNQNFSFFSGAGVDLYKNCFCTIEELHRGFHLPKSNIWDQNPYGRKNDLIFFRPIF